MPDTDLKARRYLRNGDTWATMDEVVLCRLWTEFLLFSPSYELARKHRSGTLTEAEQARLPSDFSDVLAVFDDFGDVQRIEFEEWWLETGIKLLGYEGMPPKIGDIDVLFRENPEQIESLFVKGHGYITERWRNEGQHPCLIVAIPLALTKEQISLQLDHTFAHYKKALPHLTPPPPKYEIHGRKYDINSMVRYLKCLLVKAHFPELKLYQVGAVAGVSSTYSARVDRDDDIEDRDALKILTSRAMSRGLMIAENAARGIFPSYTKNENAVAPNWEEIMAIVDCRGDWLDELEAENE